MGASGAIWARLDDEWGNLCQQPGWQAPASWAAFLPNLALPPVTLLDDLLLLVREPDDDVTAGLIHLAQDGDQLAGRIVLQAMLPRLWSLCRRDPYHDMTDYVGAAWLRLMSFPIGRRPQAVVVNLSLDCLRSLSREAAHHRREQPFQASWDSQPMTPDPVADYIDALLDTAARHNLSSPKAIAILRSVYRDGLSGRDAATRHGVSYDMVRYHCSHSIRALRAHRAELLDELGSW